MVWCDVDVPDRVPETGGLQMRKLALLALMIFALVGCQPSAAMLEAEIAYYEYTADIMKAQAAPQKPILEIRAMDPTKDMVFSNVASITVYATPNPKEGPLMPQYRQVDYSAPWIPAFTGVAAGLIGVGGIWATTHELGKYWTSGTNYNMYGQGSSVKILGGTTSNVTQSGGSLGQVGPTDATSTPTVVKPEVVVVPSPEPVVVNPVVVGQ